MKLFTSAALFLLLISLVSVSYSQIPQSEREALIALYHATGGDNWDNNWGWTGANSTECTWYGIICSGVQLTHIVLNNNNLSGSIFSAKLSNLTDLEVLKLYDNSLTGSIPAGLGNLTNLTTLWLHNNSLTGSIPTELGNLTNLVHLNLSNNSLSGSIPALLGNLTNLRHIYLYSNSLTGSIPALLGNLTNLNTISFRDNSLSGSIPAALGNLTNLSTLWLADNSLTGSIPAELGNLTGLNYLYLNNNTLDGPLPQWLSDMAIPYTDFTGAFGLLPSVAISGIEGAQVGAASGDWFRTVADTDGNPGETVSFTGTATDSDGTITTTEWLVGGSVVATGLTPSIALPNGSTAVTFRATDDNGNEGTQPRTVTVLSISVTISGGSRGVADTDGIAGEKVSFTGIATDNDGTITTTEWLVGGSVVATGLTPSIALPNGSTVVTFKATDNDGDHSTTTATITVAIPTYTVTDKWPSPYNGVTPDSSLGLAFNNIGIYDMTGSTIYTCLRVFTDGLPGSVDGIGEFDIVFTVVSIDEGTVQVTKFREFNVIGALNENVELPCPTVAGSLKQPLGFLPTR